MASSGLEEKLGFIQSRQTEGERTLELMPRGGFPIAVRAFKPYEMLARTVSF